MSADSPHSRRSTGFYAPELDALRWFAVLGVMLAHFSWTWNQRIDWGGPGVRLFFVLSGFLITHVLLRVRDDCGRGLLSRPTGLRIFLVRRVFRLWPLYFASLVLAYGLQLPGTESPFWWHGTFLTNHYVFSFQQWPGLLAHYWTLALEQQFYLLWPLVVLWLPSRALSGVLVALIFIGPAGRFLELLHQSPASKTACILLPSCVDFFALGAVSTIAWRRDLLIHLGSRVLLRSVVFFAGGWLIVGAWLDAQGRPPGYFRVWDATVQAFGFAALIVYLLRFPDGRFAGFLRWRPFVYLGQISYGIYVLHNLSHRFGPSICRRITGENYLGTESVHVLFYIVLSIAMAAISFHVLEEPLRRLGQRLVSGTSARPRAQSSARPNNTT